MYIVGLNGKPSYRRPYKQCTHNLSLPYQVLITAGSTDVTTPQVGVELVFVFDVFGEMWMVGYQMVLVTTKATHYTTLLHSKCRCLQKLAETSRN